MSIFLYDNDVYVAGYAPYGGRTSAAIWKNGIVTFLSNGINTEAAIELFIKDNVVYVSGVALVGGSTEIKIWKNNIATVLSNNEDTDDPSIFVSKNNDVYVTGYSGVPAKYWKNNVITDATEDTINYTKINDIFIVE